MEDRVYRTKKRRRFAMSFIRNLRQYAGENPLLVSLFVVVVAWMLIFSAIMATLTRRIEALEARRIEIEQIKEDYNE